MTLEECRNDFERSAKRSLSMPIAGAFYWLVIAVISTQAQDNIGLLALLFGSGTIFPIALLVSKITREEVFSSKNPLAKLMGLSVLMVNLLWALHIPLFLYAPEFLSLSLGIGLGLHWIVYSWIIQHPLGLIHALLRTVLVLSVWLLFPDSRLTAVSFSVVLVYGLSIWQMLNRTIPDHKLNPQSVASGSTV
ncbi:DUF7010 family protein [Cellvibrio japonicus]|uniref:Putative membrane protein n=1 Tax=Cellvibrio japonicus (strain Ueda107) TaxID=498211 RepID=B3PEC6_CELJU|nr:hypothetical protein [Cellvibrio japonicus]ACE86139.1 putative membrane protein [Cellvibrio japonicus Ueda107]QEI13505.1 hypothetical protein FY117_15595 [Cellvibrio japonicus]QEI17079.1 hypothetical protein FY116_15600 [Cellvibrio japonicus]QEI20657.1 hypothetical protein FY115_15595 [Cellvibrio japonicus]